MINWDVVKSDINCQKPICLYDFPNRENETDVLYIGQQIDAQKVDLLRRIVGGPLAIYVQGKFLQRIDIPTFKDLIDTSMSNDTLKHLVKMSRGHDPRFAISIDARDNKTGCSSVECAHTSNVLYDLLLNNNEMTDKELAQNFSERLKSPGHVPIIKVANNLLNERKGHAELALYIAQKLGFIEFAVASELIDPVTLKSMTPSRATLFAKNNKMLFIRGDDVIKFAKSQGDIK